MKSFKIEMLLNNYIAHPFWPETNLCIDIEKKSGVNRQKSEDKRKAALEAECGKREMTYADYLAAKVKATEQWYKNEHNQIFIPRHQVAGALVQTIGTSPKALRGEFTKDDFRCAVQISDFVTDRTKSDGTFTRFVKLEGSNQRSLQSNDYIGIYLDKGTQVLACGTISLVSEDVKTQVTVKGLFNAMVTRIGLGAARKMGFGRGEIVNWSAVE